MANGHMGNAAQRNEVLIVEDNPTDVLMLIDAIRESDPKINVFTVNDGEGAMEYLFATGIYAHRDIHDIPKIVFLALDLPKTDGVEVLKAMRAQWLFRQIPVVILSSSALDGEISHCYSHGANGFLVKPIKMDEYRAALRSACEYWLRFNRAPDLPPGNILRQ